MYQFRTQYEYDLKRTLHALKYGIKDVTTSPERIAQLLTYNAALV